MPTSGGSGGGGGTGLPYQTFSGSPVGVVTPTAAGYMGLDTTNHALYFAAAATSVDWVQVSGTPDLTAPGFGATTAGGPMTMQLTTGVTVFIVQDSGGNNLLAIADTSTGGGTELIDKGGAGITLRETDAGPILLDADGTGSVQLGVSGDKLGFFGTTPIDMDAITGSLSTVVDPAAQAVLTAIIAALAPAAGYGLVTDSTT